MVGGGNIKTRAEKTTQNQMMALNSRREERVESVISSL